METTLQGTIDLFNEETGLYMETSEHIEWQYENIFRIDYPQENRFALFMGKWIQPEVILWCGWV